MSEEYVKISRAEKQFGQNNLLYSQLELLDSLKRIKIYGKLREQELLLKIELKNKIKELSEMIEKLNKMLPVSNYYESYEERIERKKSKDRDKKEKNDLSLEAEIAEIQRKISLLKSEM